MSYSLRSELLDIYDDAIKHSRLPIRTVARRDYRQKGTLAVAPLSLCCC